MFERKLNNDGYVLIYYPEHHRAFKKGGYKNWVYEHIVVAEKSLGRKLKSDEEVHHFDLTRSNNNPNNLLVCNAKQHKMIHAWINRGLNIKSINLLPATKHISSKKEIKIRRCINCGLPLADNLKFACDEICYTPLKVMRSTRMPKDNLIYLLERYNYTQLGKRLGVSDNAIRKWIKYYGLNPRDYGRKKSGKISKFMFSRENLIIRSFVKNKTKINEIKLMQVR